MTQAAAGRSHTPWHLLPHPESFCVTIIVFICLRARKPNFSTTCKFDSMDAHILATQHTPVCQKLDAVVCFYRRGACFYLVCAPVTGLKWAEPNRERYSFFSPLSRVNTVQPRTCVVMSVRWTWMDIMLKGGRAVWVFFLDINCVGNSSMSKSVNPLPSMRKIPGP